MITKTVGADGERCWGCERVWGLTDAEKLDGRSRGRWKMWLVMGQRIRLPDRRWLSRTYIAADDERADEDEDDGGEEDDGGHHSYGLEHLRARGWV